MSRRHPVTSFVACATPLLVAITATPVAHARPDATEQYLRCVARERAQPLRDPGATAALLKLERYAICYRLNVPARDARTDSAATPCTRKGHARQRERLRVVAAQATVAAREAREIAAALSGEEATHALRVARDLEVQAAALQRHGDAPDTDAAGAPPCPPPA
mgnify:CR=1 FL=1